VSIYSILPSFKTLRVKLLTVILPMMLFNFILFAFLYTVISYRNMYADQVAKIHEFTRIQSQVITQPLWNMDYEFIHQHLNSMMLYPWVSQVILTEFNSGKIMERGELPRGLPDKDYIKTEEQIDITRNSLNFLIGKLTVISLTNSIYKSLLDTLKWVSLLGILLLVTMIISVMITHRIIIGRPLDRFLLSIRKADETEKREPVEWSSGDEIGRVIAAYNTLLINLNIGEKALKKSEKKYRLLVESMNEGLIIYDDSDRVSFANSRFCEIVDYPLEEIGNKDVSSLVSRESYEDTFRKLSDVRNGERFAMESELMKKSGRKTPVILSATPIFDGNDYKGTVCVITDISELKKVENKLRHTQKKYRDIFENVAEGIFRSTIDGRFLEVNPAMAAIFGFDTPGDMIRNISDIGQQLYEEKTEQEKFFRLLESKKNILQPAA